MYVNNLPWVALNSVETRIQTSDLLIASPANTIHHWATQIHTNTLFIMKTSPHFYSSWMSCDCSECMRDLSADNCTEI